MIQEDDYKGIKESLRTGAEVIVIFFVTCLLFMFCSSCATKREIVEKTDTLIVTKTDTIKDVHYVTQKEKEYVDRWNDRIVTINLKGDTVKDVQKQIVYVEKDSYLRDSLDMYKARYDALLKSTNTNKEKVTEKVSWWQRVKDNLLMILLTLAVIFILAISLKKQTK